MSKVVQRNYAIAGKSLEEIIEQVRLVLSYDGEVSKVVITRGNILAEYVAPNTEPPYGEIPETPVDNLSDVLGRVQLEHVDMQDVLDMEALSVISSALIHARKLVRSGVAWVVSDGDAFYRWLGLERPVSRLLDVPVYVVDKDSLPSHNLVLLCGRTGAVSPLKSDLGILMVMED